jgi:hypothetical protein
MLQIKMTSTACPWPAVVLFAQKAVIMILSGYCGRLAKRCKCYLGGYCMHESLPISVLRGLLLLGSATGRLVSGDVWAQGGNYV